MPAEATSTCLHRAEHPPRRCAEDGCPTWLSSWNPTNHCSAHGGWVVFVGDNQERSDAIADLQELMADG